MSTLAEPTGSPAAWPDTYGDEARPRMGFFTDTSVCIGCKACEVACDRVPSATHGFTGDSLDNTVDLDADHWRHVAFVEQRVEAGPLTLAATPPSPVREAQAARRLAIRGALAELALAELMHLPAQAGRARGRLPG